VILVIFLSLTWGYAFRGHKHWAPDPRSLAAAGLSNSAAWTEQQLREAVTATHMLVMFSDRVLLDAEDRKSPLGAILLLNSAIETSRIWSNQANRRSIDPYKSCLVATAMFRDGVSLVATGRVNTARDELLANLEQCHL
jgi:hypothetical protein